MDQTYSWPQILQKLAGKEHLTREESQWSMQQIMSGESAKEDVVNFLLQLRAKGETNDEIAGFVDIMLENSVKVPVTQDAIDIVGTGGDQIGTVNISSMAAIVIAASGYPVLKHGSRSASGKTGSSEMLEKLGIKLDLSPEQLSKVFDQVGITFFFAPLFHPALKHVAPIRKEMGVPTTFNFLGPLANPVQPLATALGVANPDLLPLMAGELAQRGRTGILFRGTDGLDELTTTGKSYVNLVKNGQIQDTMFDPASLGIPYGQLEALIGGDAEHNAQVARDLFAGKLGEQDPITQIVALNAAVGMAAYGLATNEEFNFIESMSRNYATAMNSITTGLAEQKLQDWIQATNGA